MPEDAPPGVTGTSSDTLREGPDDPGPGRVELAVRVSRGVAFHEGALERRADNEKPELTTLADGKPEDVKAEDNGPNASALDDDVGTFVMGTDTGVSEDRLVEDVEFQRPLEDGNPEEDTPEEGNLVTG